MLEYKNLAYQAINELPDSDSKQAFIQLIEYITNRNY